MHTDPLFQVFTYIDYGDLNFTELTPAQWTTRTRLPGETFNKMFREEERRVELSRAEINSDPDLGFLRQFDLIK